MIKKLRRKFVLIAMLSLFLVMLVVLGSVNAVNLYQINRKADSLLTLLTDNNGKFPDLLPSGEPEPPHKRPGGGLDLSPETRFETRYFVVKTDAAGGISQIDTGHIAAVTADQAQTFAEKVLESGKTGGYTGVYKYRVTDTDYGRLLVFLDCRSQLQTAATFLLASCAIAAVCLLLVFLLVSVLSRRAIRPFAESFEKQKQFITDAGHEIKTPLAIISANIDVLELTGDKNEWTDSIRRQTRRLDGLVKNLLTLARMEEERPVAAFSPFPLSDTAREAAEPFRPLAESRGIRYELDIQPGLSLNGDETAIRELVTILADNAVKYAEDGGWIRIRLASDGRGIRLETANSVAVQPEGDLNRLFDRFYRADSSRSRKSGGYGIGLSIAKAIVESHKGRILVRRPDEHSLAFIVVL